MMLLGTWSFRFLARSPDVEVAGIPLLSATLLLGGVVAAIAAIRAFGATVRRTQYRPIRWTLDETMVVTAGAAVVLALSWIGAQGDASMLHPTVIPLVWPTLGPLAAAALGVAALPAVITPRPLTVRAAA